MWSFKSFGYVMMAALLFGAVNAPRAFAVDGSTIATDSCDADVQDLMRSRAWMESQREIEVAETIMTQPESVFDLTCYSDHLDSSKAIALFGEDLSSAVDGLISTSSMTCGTMKDLSESLRCGNVDKDTYFPDFDSLVSSDMRSCPSDSTRNSNWSDANSLINLTTLPRAADAGGSDAYESYLDKLTTYSCDDSAFISTGIQTVAFIPVDEGGSTDPITFGNQQYGVRTIDGEQLGPYITESKVCIAAGCYFSIKENKCAAAN